MTTVGFGDFTARANLGHPLAVIEALLAQFYLVTVSAARPQILGAGLRSCRRPDSLRAATWFSG
jgi:2-succinyl-5-enolpyruvyl-6-hydroxy-3-cyclohexene-1-carboxylate synthase